MTILTSLYEIAQLNEIIITNKKVQERVSEIRNTANNLQLNDKSSQHDLRKVALFDTCLKRRIYAIKRLNDVTTLQILAKKDNNLVIREEAKNRLDII